MKARGNYEPFGKMSLGIPMRREEGEKGDTVTKSRGFRGARGNDVGVDVSG